MLICCVQAGNYLGRGAEYVNALHRMIGNLVCFTDDPTGLNDGIEARPLPEKLDGWWNKLALFKKGVFPEGEQVFYFDLDTLVISAPDIFSYTGDFCALRDFYRRDGLGSGLMSWKPEKCYDIWDKWVEAGMPQPAGGDQAWIETVKPDADRWQDLYASVVSYKAHCHPYPPGNASIICFHGEPRPHNCTQAWVQDVWRGNRASLQLTTIPNTNDDKIFANIRANENAAPWVKQAPEHGEIAIICGSGPSLLDMIPVIEILQGKVFALNNAAKTLYTAGVTVDYQVLLDARKGNTAFFGKYAGAYLIASQCDPENFAYLKDEQVYLWHPFIEGIEDLFPSRNMTLIGGGTTVGLSGIALAYAMGFRKFALFGYDSSFRNGRTHVLPQARTPQESRTFEVMVNDKTFLTNAAMAKQAELFQQFAENLADAGCEIAVYGDGLLPYIAHQIAHA